MIWRCDLSPQYLKYKSKVDKAIERVLKSGVYILNKEVSSFESEFANYIGVKHAVGVANGTDALILSLRVLGIGPGDEVITTPFTAIPTLSAIIAVGAKPIMVDIEENTLLMDLTKVNAAITSKTKAIMPVHIFGNMIDIPKLRKIVGSKIKIIEDACQAHGSMINNKKAGSMADLGAFSFYPTKNLGGYGDGGAIVTNDSSIDKKLRLLRMYGMTDREHIVINGYNSRLDELQAAVLRVKLKYLDAMNAKRQLVFKRYKKGINSKFIKFIDVPKNVYCNYHVLTLKFLGDRTKFIKYLDKKKIQTNYFYLMPLYLQEANKFLKVKKGTMPVVEKVCNQVFSITMYPELTKKTQDFVIDAINSYKD